MNHIKVKNTCTCIGTKRGRRCGECSACITTAVGSVQHASLQTVGSVQHASLQLWGVFSMHHYRLWGVFSMHHYSCGECSACITTDCGECSACITTDCGKCDSCKDMKKFGGPGKKKKCCIERKCVGRGI